MHRALATYAVGQDDAALLIEKYGGLIDRTARRLVARTGVPSLYGDLWSSGALGLMEAARRFDASRGATFETFVNHRIRGAMLDELRRLDHLPRRLRSRTDEIQKAKHKLQAKLGREAETEELATELDMDIEEVGGIEALSAAPLPLDTIIATLKTESRVEEAVDRARLVGVLADAIGTLPERLQILVSLHYVEGLSYREISKIFDVSEPRICQLHGEATKLLRARLAERGVDQDAVADVDKTGPP